VPAGVEGVSAPAGQRGSPGCGGPAQRTEEIIGPYELQDFHLYFVSRYGFRPSKVAFLAHHAWGDRSAGAWPPGFPEAKRREYDLAAIKKWLGVFLRRFFEESQFKRSAMPNGPKVGSGGSLSPRSDWRAPSDAEPASGSRSWSETCPRPDSKRRVRLAAPAGGGRSRNLCGKPHPTELPAPKGRS
jgi:hypothetical protein